MKNLRNYVIVLLELGVLSCSSDDDQAEETIFNIALDQTDYSTSFYQDGQTQPLVISSNLNAPTVINIDGNPEYLQYIEDTQRISWTKALPIGITEATIRATAGDEVTTINVSIKNVFSGLFSGFFVVGPEPDGSASLDISNFEFYEDNSFDIEWGTEQYSSGYAIEGDMVTSSFLRTNGQTFILVGTLSYQETQIPTITGFWYIDSVSDETLGGYIQIVYQD